MEILFLCLLWFGIKFLNIDNENGNLRSLAHALLTTVFNAYILITKSYTKQFLGTAVKITGTYMYLDTFFMFMDGYKELTLYTVHHIGVLMALNIISYSSNEEILQNYAMFAFLAEITNIIQQCWQLSIYYKTSPKWQKFWFNLFVPFYIVVRCILIPFLILQHEYTSTKNGNDKLNSMQVSFIGLLFVCVSIYWIKQQMIYYNYTNFHGILKKE